jgi:hypothetical protein
MPISLGDTWADVSLGLARALGVLGLVRQSGCRKAGLNDTTSSFECPPVAACLQREVEAHLSGNVIHLNGFEVRQ